MTPLDRPINLRLDRAKKAPREVRPLSPSPHTKSGSTPTKHLPPYCMPPIRKHSAAKTRMESKNHLISASCSLLASLLCPLFLQVPWSISLRIAWEYAHETPKQLQ